MDIEKELFESVARLYQSGGAIQNTARTLDLSVWRVKRF